MKLVAPPIQVAAEDGFVNDVLKREPYGQALCNVISRSQDELVICLDGKWGEGKTTFVKMLRGLLSESSIPSIYIDAFSSDHVEDPFFAVASEIATFAEESGIKDEANSELKKRTVAAGVQLLSWGAKIGLKAATLGVLTSSDIEALGEVKADIADGVSEMASEFVQERLNAYSSSMTVFDSYRASLSALPKAIDCDTTNKLVVIIDELDRCKPTFAVSLIEQVKHLFSVPNVAFILVMNKEQLQESIRAIYGRIDASTYLQKFINLETRIPRKSTHYSDRSDVATYIRHLWNVHDFESWGDERNIVDCLELLAKHFDLSLRQVERVFTNIGVLYGTTAENHLRLVPLIVFLAVLKVTDGEIFNQLLNGKIGYQELTQQLKLDEKNVQEGQRKLEWMLEWVRFAVLTEDEYNSLPQEDPLKNDFGKSLWQYNVERTRLIPIFTQHLSAFVVT
jgi:energy-coupling factor transporter ATP-binding protein EcfA2